MLPTQLEQAVVPVPVREVIGLLKAAGHQAFLVGGCVRDLLRGATPKDFDVATSATPDAVVATFRGAGHKVIPTGIQHGTVTVLIRGAHVEVTTFRTEGPYVDGRRPEHVAFHSEIEADLSRRDFTMNAMAFDPADKRLVDPFDGQVDLAGGVVRCVRDAMERFLEDGLRPLRAVRFAAVLGFRLEVGTEAAIRPTLPVFRKVALERVNQEFTRLLLSERAPHGLELLDRTGLLDAFLPEARREAFPAVGRAPAELVTRLALLLLDATSPSAVALRLKFKNRDAGEADALVRHRTLPLASAPDAALRRWLAAVEPRRLGALLDVAAALGEDVAALRARAEALLAAKPPLSAKELALDGRAIMETLGVGPSRVVGEATRFLLELVLDDPALNTADALSAAVRQRFAAP